MRKEHAEVKEKSINNQVDQNFCQGKERGLKMKEQSLVLIKPDGVQRSLIGEIIKRFEQRSLKIVALKMVKPSKELAEKHYPASDQQLTGMGNKTLQAAKDSGREGDVKKIFKTTDAKEIGKTLRSWLVNFLISGPVVAMVVEGNRAIGVVRKICGFTDPAKADVGTIRGDFGHTGIEVWNIKESAVKNLVHASGSPEEAKFEIPLWFKPKEILEYKIVHEEHAS
jgi:nucleoside-diphosphate kinase